MELERENTSVIVWWPHFLRASLSHFLLQWRSYYLMACRSIWTDLLVARPLWRIILFSHWLALLVAHWVADWGTNICSLLIILSDQLAHQWLMKWWGRRPKCWCWKTHIESEQLQWRQLNIFMMWWWQMEKVLFLSPSKVWSSTIIPTAGKQSVSVALSLTRMSFLQSTYFAENIDRLWACLDGSMGCDLRKAALPYQLGWALLYLKKYAVFEELCYTIWSGYLSLIDGKGLFLVSVTGEDCYHLPQGR